MLKLELDTTPAVGSVKTLDKALDVTEAKLKLMRDAFSKINLTQLREARKELDALSKAKIFTERQLTSISKQNEALAKQAALASQLSVAIKNHKAVQDDKTKGIREETKSLTELQKLQKRFDDAVKQSTVYKSVATEQVKHYIKTIDRQKIHVESMTTTARLSNIETKNGSALQIQRIATEREVEKSIRRLGAAEGKLLPQVIARDKETKKLTESLKQNKVATISSAKGNAMLSSSLASGNLHAAEFRAGLAAMGLSFGIFTGSTIVAAASIFALVRGFRAVIESGAEFEFTMDRVNAVMNTTPKEAALLDKAVRDLAETTIFTAGEVSKGLVFLGMAGFNAAKAMLALEPTLRLAQIGMIDMERSADLLTNIMAGFNIEASQVASTVDKLAIVVTSSNTSITQLAQAMSLVGPAAANTNTSLEETIAMLGFFGNVGIKATRSGTALRRGIANLANPSDKVLKVMHDLGITITGTNGKMRSMVDIMTDLHKSGATLGDVFEIFGARAGPAFAAAILRGTDDIHKLIAAQDNATGSSKALTEALEDNAYTDFKKVISAIHENLIALYEGMDGALRTTLQGAITLFRGLGGFLKENATILSITAKLLLAYAAALLIVKAAHVVLNLHLAGSIVAMGVMNTGLLYSELLLTRFSVAITFLSANPLLAVGFAVSALAVFMYSAETATERLTSALKRQAKVSQDLQNLTASSGVSFQTAELESSERILNRIKALNDKKGPTIAKQLRTHAHDARMEVKDLEKELKNLLTTQSVANMDDKFAISEDAHKMLAHSIKLRKEEIQLAKDTVEEVGLVRKMIEDEAHAKGIYNSLLMTEAQLKTEFARVRKDELELDKKAADAKATLAQTARKKLALDKEQLKLDIASKGAKKDLLKAQENIRKFKEGNLLKALSANASDDSEIVKQLDKIFKDRATAIETLEASLTGNVAVYQKVIDDLRGGTKQQDQFKLSFASLDKDGKDFITIIEGFYKQIEQLKLQQAKTLQKRTEITLKNEVADEKARFEEALVNKRIQIDKILREDLRLADRGKDILEFQFKANLVSLTDYAEKFVAINNEIINSKIQAAQSEIEVEKANRFALLEKANALNDVGESSKDWMVQVTAANKKINTLTELIGILNNGLRDHVGVFEKMETVTGDWVLAAQKVNAELNMQALLFGFAKAAGGSASVALIEYHISQINLAISMDKATDAMRANLIELDNERIKMIDLEKVIRGLSDVWDVNAHTMEGKALSSAVSMKDAMTEFFINPTKDGFDDLADHFAKLVQRMMAEQLALKLFNGEDGKGGLGNFFTKMFGTLFGGTKSSTTTTTGVPGGSPSDNWFGPNATGGSHTVQGAGGIDSARVSFLATPGERVTISNPNGGDNGSGKGGQTITNHFNNVVTITGGGDSKDIEIKISAAMRQLEDKITRQQQRSQKALGIR